MVWPCSPMFYGRLISIARAIRHSKEIFVQGMSFQGIFFTRNFFTRNAVPRNFSKYLVSHLVTFLQNRIRFLHYEVPYIYVWSIIFLSISLSSFSISYHVKEKSNFERQKVLFWYLGKWKSSLERQKVLFWYLGKSCFIIFKNASYIVKIQFDYLENWLNCETNVFKKKFLGNKIPWSAVPWNDIPWKKISLLHMSYYQLFGKINDFSYRFTLRRDVQP